jgi:hypothetical protein
MNFSGIAFFILENSEIQFLLSINKLYISWQLLKFVLFESQISFIVRKLLCRNEVNPNTISPDKLKIKVIQGIFKQNIKPKCQVKWEEQYGGNIDWTQIWTKLKKIKVTNKVKEFQWKCLHNIKCFLKLFFQVLKIVWSPIRVWLYLTLLRIFHISHFEINIKMPSLPNKRQRWNDAASIF